jgi:hypothetical protein
VEDWRWKKGLVRDAETDGIDRYQPEGGRRPEQDDGLGYRTNQGNRQGDPVGGMGDQGGGRERKKEGDTWQQLKNCEKVC